jgi:hypothetical protein
MKATKLRLLVPSVLGALALGALAPASAPALLAVPEIGRCVKVPVGTGEYEIASCTGGQKATGGRFDWEKAAKSKFSGGAVSLWTIEAVGGKRIECTAFSATGEYYVPFPQDEELNLHLFGCKETTFNFECKNSAPEELDFVMFGEYGFIRNFTKEGKLVVSVGMALKFDDPQKFECGPNKNQYRMEGGVVGAVTPIDKASSTFTFKYAQSGGKQKPRHFEGGFNQAFTLEETFPAMPPEEAGLGVTFANVNEEPIEIKAKE